VKGERSDKKNIKKWDKSPSEHGEDGGTIYIGGRSLSSGAVSRGPVKIYAKSERERELG